MYNKKIEDPEVFVVKSEITELCRSTEMSFREESSETVDFPEAWDEKVVAEAPTGGSLEFYVDDEGSGSYFSIEGGGDSEIVKLENTSRLEFDVRPEDDQYRVIFTGDKNFDFGL